MSPVPRDFLALLVALERGGGEDFEDGLRTEVVFVRGETRGNFFGISGILISSLFLEGSGRGSLIQPVNQMFRIVFVSRFYKKSRDKNNFTICREIFFSIFDRGDAIICFID